MSRTRPSPEDYYIDVPGIPVFSLAIPHHERVALVEELGAAASLADPGRVLRTKMSESRMVIMGWNDGMRQSTDRGRATWLRYNRGRDCFRVLKIASLERSPDIRSVTLWLHNG